ncbi:hypothetical protein IEQ34_020238 [Dendrobium chrysotoxum]|uniref:Uncharacterized protein n=1 Tax=Dendrobium chrysotoxum TaxID=161865 RepID=A0AAV7FZY9_DENCH|nr:hypothetical protein IEQ34_020238 [Dendrobium chrysotoxum]
MQKESFGRVYRRRRLSGVELEGATRQEGYNILVAYMIRESHLRWFGHRKHRPYDGLIIRVDILDLIYVNKYKNRPKMTWLENITNIFSY